MHWAHSKVDEIFHRIGNGNDSRDAVYLMLKSVLEYCLYDYYPSFSKKITIIINWFSKEEGDYWIRVNGPGLHITSDSLRSAVADMEKIRKYLSFLSEPGESKLTPVVVNALSSFFSISSVRNRMEAILKYEEGEEYYDLIDKKEEDGIVFHIVPDKTVFGEYSLQIEPILPIIYNLLKDNPGHSISIQQGFDGEPFVFNSEALIQADKRITNAVTHKNCDMILSDNYVALLPAAQAISICFPADGYSEEIAEQIMMVTKSIKCEGCDAISAVEIKATDAVICESSVVIGTIEDCFNLKREVIGDDAKHYGSCEYGFCTRYSNVIVSIIQPVIA